MSDLPLMGMTIEADAETPLFEQVYDALRVRIVTGQLATGDRLPASRKLAEDLGVSRTTVVTAYDQLIAEGFARGRAGSGVYVSETGEVELEPSTLEPAGAGHGPAAPLYPLKPFQPGLADMRLFPYRQWGRCFARVARTEPEALLKNDDPFGDYLLRSEICRYLSEWRALKAAPEQVMVTAGSADAVEKCLQTLAGQSDCIGLEDPGYAPLRLFVQNLGQKTSWLAMDGDGAIPPTASQKRPRPALVVLTPSSQYPLGGAMPRRRRNEFLTWAAESDGWIVEDDYDSEFRYAGRPIPALASLDAHGRTLYIGSFAKVFSNGLRLGFLVVPPNLVPRFSETLRRYGTKASITPQRALALFMQNGDFYRHIRRVRRIYADRRAALIALLNEHLEGYVSFEDHRAGMQIAVELPEGCDDKAISATAASQGIICPALSSYFAAPSAKKGLLLGFCGFAAEEMEAAMVGLRAVLEDALP